MRFTSTFHNSQPIGSGAELCQRMPPNHPHLSFPTSIAHMCNMFKCVCVPQFISFMNFPGKVFLRCQYTWFVSNVLLFLLLSFCHCYACCSWLLVVDFSPVVGCLCFSFWCCNLFGIFLAAIGSPVCVGCIAANAFLRFRISVWFGSKCCVKCRCRQITHALKSGFPHESSILT